MFSKSLIALAASVLVVSATPMDARGPKLIEVGPAPTHHNVTSNGLHTDAVAANPVFYACQTSNCASSCYGLSIVDRTYKQCYNTIGSYVSLYIQSNTVAKQIPYQVYVGPCPNGYMTPKIDTCYNIAPAATQFYVTSGYTFLN